MILASQSPEEMADLADSALKQGRIQDAEMLFSQALHLAPGNHKILKSIGFMMLNTGRHRQALDFLGRAAKVNPDDAKTHNGLGIAFQNINYLDEAEKSYKKAIQIDPVYEAAYSNLVSVLERRNQIPAARNYIDQAKGLFPEGKLIILNEATVLKREGKINEAIALLEAGQYPQDPMTLIKVRHELGQMYDRLGDTDRAFRYFQDFNGYATQAFGINHQSKAQYLDKIEKCKTVFTPEWVSTWNRYEQEKDVKSPVCLTGFVRSGTTLLQHVLNAHPAIYATEEVHAFPIVEEMIQKDFPSYPECLSGLTPEQIQGYAREYYRVHREDRNWEEAEILVDKYPLLTGMVGMVHRIFPRSKFVFVTRHPCDCVLSAYMQIFVPNEASVHFYDLGDAVNLYMKLMDLLDVYERALPLNVHYVRYEDMTGDFENTIRNLLGFLELPWDAGVLAYDKKVKEKANVISPSYAQVSEKIYDRATYRWVRYRKYLKPYLEQLKPYAERFGYEINC